MRLEETESSRSVLPISRLTASRCMSGHNMHTINYVLCICCTKFWMYICIHESIFSHQYHTAELTSNNNVDILREKTFLSLFSSFFF